MHQVITVVVEATDEQSAVSAAKEFFEAHLHVSEGGPFDYCQEMTAGETVAGSDRWTDYQDSPLAAPVTTEWAQEQVDQAWQWTCDYIMENAETVWDAAHEHDSAEAFGEYLLRDEDLTRHRMSKLGYVSTDYYLYVQGWSSLGLHTNRGKNYLDKLVDEESETETDDWWAVPLDVHY